MFAFKRFTVRQEGAAMKVGTDGVLVGAWARIPEGCRRILDIGTGTGLIALMAAQRSNGASITGVEIDASSAAQARENVYESDWRERIEIIHTDICDYCPTEKFDIIISNPPFYNGTLTSPDDGRTKARHTVTLGFKGLMAAAERLIAPEGRFSVIVPSESVGALVAAGNMHLIRRCDVRTKTSKPPKRTMLEFSPLFEGAALCEELAIRDDSDNYTEQYRALTADFYLNL